jgi:hypothetical protein
VLFDDGRIASAGARFIEIGAARWGDRAGYRNP